MEKPYAATDPTLGFEEELLINDTIPLWQKEVTQGGKSYCVKNPLCPFLGNEAADPLECSLDFQPKWRLNATDIQNSEFSSRASLKTIRRVT
jgi:hypothetical protein